jgi:hypothetical protein
MNGLNVVIVCRDKGKFAAAVVITRIDSTFRKVRFGLGVGIAGGVPKSNKDLRLGGEVVSTGDGRSGGGFTIGGKKQQRALNHDPSWTGYRRY